MRQSPIQRTQLLLLPFVLCGSISTAHGHAESCASLAAAEKSSARLAAKKRFRELFSAACISRVPELIGDAPTALASAKEAAATSAAMALGCEVAQLAGGHILKTKQQHTSDRAAFQAIACVPSNKLLIIVDYSVSVKDAAERVYEVYVSAAQRDGGTITVHTRQDLNRNMRQQADMVAAVSHVCLAVVLEHLIRPEVPVLSLKDA